MAKGSGSAGRAGAGEGAGVAYTRNKIRTELVNGLDQLSGDIEYLDSLGMNGDVRTARAMEGFVLNAIDQLVGEDFGFPGISNAASFREAGLSGRGVVIGTVDGLNWRVGIEQVLKPTNREGAGVGRITNVMGGFTVPFYNGSRYLLTVDPFVARR